jgi:hypothetical protein
MNAIRTIISLFIGVLIVAAIAGLVWTADHQPPAQVIASRLVLGASALAGLAGLLAIWLTERRTGRG